MMPAKMNWLTLHRLTICPRTRRIAKLRSECPQTVGMAARPHDRPLAEPAPTGMEPRQGTMRQTRAAWPYTGIT